MHQCVTEDCGVGEEGVICIPHLWIFMDEGTLAPWGQRFALDGRRIKTPRLGTQAYKNGQQPIQPM